MTPAYSRTQIVLHWAIFALIVLQFVFHEPMDEAWRQVRRGLVVEFSPAIAQHVVGGMLVLVLVLLRLFIRVRRGAPALPENEPASLKFAAHATHMGLYLLMLLMPISGAMAWIGGIHAAGDAHEVMKTLMLLLVFVHIAGALFQAFILKTDVMARMARFR